MAGYTWSLTVQTGARPQAPRQDTVSTVNKMCLRDSYTAETEGENIKLSFDLRIPHCVDLEETAEKIRRYGEEKAIRCV